MIDPQSIRVPSGEDVIDAELDDFNAYTRTNDHERLRRVVAALLDSLPGEHRMQILNALRGRESRGGDWPYFVASKSEDD